eukprot:scaffold188_cov204-Chaetoceros_neogracile.AAC.1
MGLLIFIVDLTAIVAASWFELVVSQLFFILLLAVASMVEMLSSSSNTRWAFLEKNLQKIGLEQDESRKMSRKSRRAFDDWMA